MIKPEGARNISFVGHSDQGGRGDGVQVMVHRGHAYVGTRVSRGIMVTDVRDPRNPKPVNFAPIHPNSWCMHLQTANDLLLCIEELDLKALLSQKDYYGGSNQVDSSRYGKRGVDFSAGMRVYDIADPAKIAERTAEYEARFLSPFVAAERGYIDEVIMPHSTRRRLSRVLAMLRNKKLENPWKKHDNIPL